MKTKKEVIQEMIDMNHEEIFRMEIVRDFNVKSDANEAKIQVDAANEKIKKCEVQLTFLNEYIKEC